MSVYSKQERKWVRILLLNRPTSTQISLALVLFLFSASTVCSREIDVAFRSNQDVFETHPQTEFKPPVDQDAAVTKLMWTSWKRRLDDTVKQQFARVATAAFGKTDVHAVVEISYVVTKKGEVKRLVLETKSTNSIFNKLALQAVLSVRGNKYLLDFPPGVAESEVQMRTVLQHPAI